MSKDSIVEGNRIIAEFDGWEIEPGMEQEADPFYNKGFNMALVSQMKYHKSWDWLMPVVEKINKIKGFDIIIYKTTVHINDERRILIETTDNTGNIIKAVWSAVVQFIQWYNLQTTKQKQ